MTATNSLGWEVQAYNRDTGWKRVDPKADPHPSVEAAKAALRAMGAEGNSYFRVYEALDHPNSRRN